MTDQPKNLAPFANRIVGYGEEAPDQLLANPENWRIHPQYQQAALTEVLDDVGWVQNVIVNKRTGHVVDGHLRVAVAMRRQDSKIPVTYVDLSHEEERKILLTIDPLSALAGRDNEKFAELLASVGKVSDNVGAMLADIARHADMAAAAAADAAMVKGAKDAIEESRKDQRLRLVDLIYTAGTYSCSNAEVSNYALAHCCMAAKSGWLYGVRSTEGVCIAGAIGRHQPQFIDNDFKAYNHEQHLGAVARWKPKYATIRDVMTRDQCREAGIEYYDLDQILRWAEELAEHAANVLIIPKFDCFKDIPEKFMLGYSVPSSYGGTPVPIEKFRGRRVHLLGGSPNRQIAYWRAAPESVVSLDNNYILKMANFGCAWCPDGKSRSLTDLGFNTLSNPLYVALAISLGNFAAFFEAKGDDPVPDVLPAAINLEDLP